MNKTVVIKDNVPYHDLPGYQEIVRSFLVEMQIRDISNYPDKLIDASEALMHDSKLLNIMITTVYSKSQYKSSAAPPVLIKPSFTKFAFLKPSF